MPHPRSLVEADKSRPPRAVRRRRAMSVLAAFMTAALLAAGLGSGENAWATETPEPEVSATIVEPVASEVPTVDLVPATTEETVGISPMSIETPGAGQIAINVRIGGDRQNMNNNLFDIDAKGVKGVTLKLSDSDTNKDRWNHSWATCTSDDDGDCTFIVPITTAATSAAGMNRATKPYVHQVSAPTGWRLVSPPLGVSTDGRFASPYVFQLNPSSNLVAGTTYDSRTYWPFMRIDPALDVGQGGDSRLASNGRWAVVRNNPPLPESCGLDVAVVVDLSTSVGSAGLPKLKSAVNALIDGLRGTPSNMSVFTFNTRSPATGTVNVPALMPVQTAAQVNAVKATQSTWYTNGITNWDHALWTVATAPNKYDLVVMITDGLPTYHSTNTSDNIFSPGRGHLRSLEAGIYSANLVKSTGARLVPFMVNVDGSGVSAVKDAGIPTMKKNLQAISGPTENSDWYFKDDYEAAAADLAALAKGNCEGTVQVTKRIVDPDFTVTSSTTAAQLQANSTVASGWSFTARSDDQAQVTIPGAVGNSYTATTATGTGTAVIPLKFPYPQTQGPLTIVETQKPGYELVQAAGKNATCSSEDGTVATTNSGGLGFSLTAKTARATTCVVYNQAKTPRWTLQKSSDPVSKSTVQAGQKITYTVTAKNTGEVALPVAIQDDLSQALAHARYGNDAVATINGSTAMAPAVSGTTLTWNGTLPVGGELVITYSMTVKGDVDPGVTLKNVVTSTGTTPPDPCPVEDPECRQTEHPTPESAARIAVEKQGSAQCLAPDADPTPVTYTYRVTSVGQEPLTDVELTDDKGTPVYLSGDTDQDGILTAGETWLYEMTSSLTEPTTNVATASAVGVDSGHKTSAQGTWSVGEPSALSVTKTSSANGATVKAGDELTYTVTVTNDGDKDATKVALSDTLPAGVSYLPGSATKTYWIDNANPGGTQRGTWTTTLPDFSFQSKTGTVQTFSTVGQVPADAELFSYMITLNGSSAHQKNDVAVIGYLPGQTPGTTEPVTGGANGVPNSERWFYVPYQQFGTGAGGTGGAGTWETRTLGTRVSGAASGEFALQWWDNENSPLYDPDNTASGVEVTLSYNYTAPTTARMPVTNAAHAPSELVTAADGITLLPGESMTVTFRVKVDDPLDPAITALTNTAVAVSEQDADCPVTGKVTDPVEPPEVKPATVTIGKMVKEAGATAAVPAGDWTVGAVLATSPAPAADVSITTPATKQTQASDGFVETPWTVHFPQESSTADVVVSETMKDGYEIEGLRCEVTHLTGSPTIVTGTDATQTLTGIKPGDSASCVFTNAQIPGTVTWEKVDNSAPAVPLSGSEWTLAGPGGFSEMALSEASCTGPATPPTTDPYCTYTATGQFAVGNLPWGAYELTETRAPAGYYPIGEPLTFTIGVGDGLELDVALGPVVNTQIEAPVLPFTGGLGRDAFFIAGLGVMALGFGAAAAVRIRNRRKEVA